jgi:hypothetical protein
MDNGLCLIGWQSAGTHQRAQKAKFGKQLSERKGKVVWAQISVEAHAAISEARRLKVAYQFQGSNRGSKDRIDRIGVKSKTFNIAAFNFLAAIES